MDVLPVDEPMADLPLELKVDATPEPPADDTLEPTPDEAPVDEPVLDPVFEPVFELVFEPPALLPVARLPASPLPVLLPVPRLSVVARPLPLVSLRLRNSFPFLIL